MTSIVDDSRRQRTREVGNGGVGPLPVDVGVIRNDLARLEKHLIGTRKHLEAHGTEEHQKQVEAIMPCVALLSSARVALGKVPEFQKALEESKRA